MDGGSGSGVKFPRGSNPAGHTDDRATPRRAIDRVALQLLDIERMRELSDRLRLPVALDVSGWLRDEIEISIRTRRDRTIWPFRVLVGPEATDLLLLDRGAIHGRCAFYNELIGRLRELKRQIAALVRDDQVAETSRLGWAHAELKHLDAGILSRQYARMGHGVVRLHILIEEVALLRAHGDMLSQIVTEYARRNADRTGQGWSAW